MNLRLSQDEIRTLLNTVPSQRVRQLLRCSCDGCASARAVREKIRSSISEHVICVTREVWQEARTRTMSDPNRNKELVRRVNPLSLAAAEHGFGDFEVTAGDPPWKVRWRGAEPHNISNVRGAYLLHLFFAGITWQFADEKVNVHLEKEPV